MLGQYQRAIETDQDRVPYISLIAHLTLGQHAEAAALVRASKADAASIPQMAQLVRLVEAFLANRFDDGRRAMDEINRIPGFSDPEGWYYWGLTASLIKSEDDACDLLDRAVAAGFHCPRALEASPLLDTLRGTPRFARLLAAAREGHEAAVIAFTKADGPRLLGLPRS
jgi:hypothetical protein